MDSKMYSKYANKMDLSLVHKSIKNSSYRLIISFNVFGDVTDESTLRK